MKESWTFRLFIFFNRLIFRKSTLWIFPSISSHYSGFNSDKLFIGISDYKPEGNKGKCRIIMEMDIVQSEKFLEELSACVDELKKRSAK